MIRKLEESENVWRRRYFDKGLDTPEFRVPLPRAENGGSE
jgi:hypothetical protein